MLTIESCVRYWHPIFESIRFGLCQVIPPIDSAAHNNTLLLTISRVQKLIYQSGLSDLTRRTFQLLRPIFGEHKFWREQTTTAKPVNVNSNLTSKTSGSSFGAKGSGLDTLQGDSNQSEREAPPEEERDTAVGCLLQGGPSFTASRHLEGEGETANPLH
jgi:hypothetical protein